jgi:tetratricopeptide (TPR) repeat protein
MMTISAAAAMLSGAAPQAIGVVTVVGNSTARTCYEAAAGERAATPENLRACDDALISGTITADDLVATRVNRGILRMKKGDEAGGIQDFEAALKLDPRQPEAFLNKGIALVRRGAGGEAVSLFTRALELKTGRPELAYYGRAIAHEQSGKVADAYYDYKRASQLKPDWAEPREELTRFRVQSRSS